MDLFLPAVVPVLVGPLQVLLTLLPGLLLAMLGGVLALFKPAGMKNLIRLLWEQRIAVIGLAIVVGGIVVLWRGVGRGAAQSAANLAQEGKPWTCARYDLQRCGAVPGSASPMRPKLVWSYREGNEGFLSSPAVVGNRVYVASANLGAFSKSGQIYCFDAETGVVVWMNAPPGYRPTFSSPVVAGDFLVCGEGLHDTADARIVCLDLRQGKEGEVVWTFATKNHVECTPVVAQGRVFVGAGDDGYYCLDLLPGEDGEPKVRWHLPGEDYPDAETSLAVHDGKVYVGLGNDGQALCVLDADTGKEIKRVSLPYPVFSPPAIADGKIYLGMGNGDYIKTGEGGAVCRLDLKTLAIDWTFDLPQTVLGAVAIKEDRLYFGCRDGYFYCLDRGGNLVNKRNLGAPIVTSPAVTDEAAYVVSESGQLWGLERETLEPLWDPFRLGISGLFISSPAVARGHVYVGTQEDGLLCIGGPGATAKATPMWANPLGGPGRAGNVDNSPIPSTASVWWQFGVDDKHKSDPKSLPFIEHNIAGWGKDLYVSVARGEHQGIVCLPGGTAQKSKPKPRWHHRTALAPEGAPVLLDDKIYFQADGLGCLDRATGKLLWHETGGEGMVSVAVGGQVWNQGLRAADGSWLWTQPDGVRFAPAFAPSLVFGIHGGASAGTVGWLRDRTTGEVLWQKSLPRSLTSPVLAKTHLLIGTEAGVQSVSLVDGAPLRHWTSDGDPVSAEFAVRDLIVAYVNAKGELVVMDRKDGKLKFKVAGCLPGLPPVVSRGQAVVAMENGLGLVDLKSKSPTLDLWLPGVRPCAPMVLVDSCLYVPTRERGLVCIGAAREP